mgnify:CR=1 FL=1
MPCPNAFIYYSVVRDILSRWFPGVQVDLGFSMEGKQVLFDGQYYPAVGSEVSEFLARFSEFKRVNGVKWLGDCYDCEDFSQLASALFSVWFKKNAMWKARGLLRVIYPDGRIDEDNHGFNTLLACVEAVGTRRISYEECVLNPWSYVVPLIFEPQIDYFLPPWDPRLRLTDGTVIEWIVKEVQPPG